MRTLLRLINVVTLLSLLAQPTIAQDLSGEQVNLVSTRLAEGARRRYVQGLWRCVTDPFIRKLQLGDRCSCSGDSGAQRDAIQRVCES